MKYIVICGPNLKNYTASCLDYRIFDLIAQSVRDLQISSCQYIRQEILPERDHGAEEVRSIVRNAIKQKDSLVVVTRYEHAISELANAVADGKITRDQFLIKLVRYKDNDVEKCYVTDHQMDETNQMVGNNWPVGILW
jgi:hypothetical protein